MDKFADYQQEREAFLTLLEPDCIERILLFIGQSGAGKTTLIQCCHESACRLTCYVPIEFNPDMIGIPEIFCRIGDCLKWDNLPEFTKKICSINPDINEISVNMAKIKIRGDKNQIRVVIDAPQGIREERLSILTTALFEDLRKMDQLIVLVMDSYEKATKEVQQWISSHFLARTVEITDKVRVAVAGQEVPDANNIVWGHICKTIRLPGVPKASHWMPVVKALGKVIPSDSPLDFMEGICHALRGRPDAIMKVIEGLERPHQQI
jgi:hypothetical protein